MIGFKNTAGQIAYINRCNRKRESWLKRQSRKRAKGLVRSATAAEEVCRAALDALGIHNRFQQVFQFQSSPGYRIVDFFLPDDHIVIEVDGPCHFTKRGASRDSERARQFAEEYPHVKFLRYTNSDVEAPGWPDRMRSDIERIRG